MARYRSNCLALVVLCAALITARAHASPLVAASSDCAITPHVVAWSSEAAVARDDDAALRLAEAARDLQAAEQAVRNDPSLAAVFGPLLRQARANLEAGLAAVAATTQIAITPDDEHDARAFDTAISASRAGAASNNTGLQLHRSRHSKPLIWV